MCDAGDEVNRCALAEQKKTEYFIIIHLFSRLPLLAAVIQFFLAHLIMKCSSLNETFNLLFYICCELCWFFVALCALWMLLLSIFPLESFFQSQRFLHCFDMQAHCCNCHFSQAPMETNTKLTTKSRSHISIILRSNSIKLLQPFCR